MGVKPSISDCLLSHNPQLHYWQIILPSVSLQILMAQQISLADAKCVTTLLEQLCLEYLAMKVYLLLCFHYALHIKDMIMDECALNNAWVWSFDNAHQTLTQAHENGHTNGVLERTMRQKWLRMQSVQTSVSLSSKADMLTYLHGYEGGTASKYPQPLFTADDSQLIKELLENIKGWECDQHWGALVSALAKKTSPLGQGMHTHCKFILGLLNQCIESIKISTQSVEFNLYKAGHGIYEKVTTFESWIWPGLHLYGDGLAVPGGIHIPRTGATRACSHFYFEGVWYGSAHHHCGRSSPFVYIQQCQPVWVEQVISVKLTNTNGQERESLMVVVQSYRAPTLKPAFSWEFS